MLNYNATTSASGVADFTSLTINGNLVDPMWYNGSSATYGYGYTYGTAPALTWGTYAPSPEEKIVFNAKKVLVMKANGGLLGVYDSLEDAQEAAEQHAESEGERAFVCKAVKIAKPTRRDVTVTEV